MVISKKEFSKALLH